MSSDGDGNQSFPFGYVLIPVLVFGVAVSFLSCCRYRFRKRQAARQADERNLEAGRQPGDIAFTSMAAQTGGTGEGGRARRLGLGLGNMEEGLNELGEAPPAYMPSAPKPPGAEGGAEFGLATYSQAVAEVGTSRSLPLYGEEPAAPALGATGGTHENAGANVEETSGIDATTVTTMSDASMVMNEPAAANATTTTAADRPTTATTSATTGETTVSPVTTRPSTSTSTNDPTATSTTTTKATTTPTPATATIETRPTIETASTSSSTTAPTTAPTAEPTAPPRAVTRSP